MSKAMPEARRLDEPAAMGAPDAVSCAEDFERRARACLGFDLPPGFGLALPGAGGGAVAAAARPRLAAVLVAVVAHRQAATVLLTQRTTALRDHAGQIALPGGKVDPGDGSPCAAALREAAEEIGLDPAGVIPFGYLAPYPTHTGFVVVPTVARVEPPLRLTLNHHEVEDAFEVPLAFLMDAANHERHVRTVAGRDHHYYAMPFAERFIWGITAGILRDLYERLYR